MHISIPYTFKIGSSGQGVFITKVFGKLNVRSGVADLRDLINIPDIFLPLLGCLFTPVDQILTISTFKYDIKTCTDRGGLAPFSAPGQR